MNYLRTIHYSYDYDQAGNLPNLKKDNENLTHQLTNARIDRTTDSPIFQLVDGMAFQNSMDHKKTDIIRDRVKYNEELKQKL